MKGKKWCWFRQQKHALAWKNSPKSSLLRLYVAPGNAGTEGDVPVQANDYKGFYNLLGEAVDLTMVGPEELSRGLWMLFEAKG